MITGSVASVRGSGGANGGCFEVFGGEGVESCSAVGGDGVVVDHGCHSRGAESWRERRGNSVSRMAKLKKFNKLALVSRQTVRYLDDKIDSAIATATAATTTMLYSDSEDHPAF